MELIKKFNNNEHGYADRTSYLDNQNENITIAGTMISGNYCEKPITINRGGKSKLDLESAISIKKAKHLIEKLKILI